MTAVEFINITKKFGSFFANRDISFSVEKNTVHCILGENGAGKTTLMKILFGMYRQDSGSLKISGEDIRFNSPHDAIAKGIGMVHQHFMLIDDFTVMENIILGNEITKGIRIDFDKTAGILNELISTYSLNLDINKKISEISISAQQKTEILKLLFRNSDILIFDEPTAVLSPAETDEFFKIIGKFKSSGKTIIFITHKLNEVRKISDKVSVLRRGMLVYESSNENRNLDLNILSQAIVGETVVKANTEKADIVFPGNDGRNAISLRNIFLKKDNVSRLKGLNLDLYKGEIHGICGVEGNGQNEIIDIITGLETEFEGEFSNPGCSISLVPDDRLKKGMISEFTIGENIILKKKSSNFISERLLDRISTETAEKYDVRVSDIKSNLSSLSGGNQQKVIFARETELESDVMIFSHPTRGVDINATVFIHSKIIEQRNKGKAVLLISSDLDELFALSDKISVIYNGAIAGTFGSEELSNFRNEELIRKSDESTGSPLSDKIGKLMIGIKTE
ncbi:MAG: ABC transporter ATP-binding protein [Ignavibacteria bacterium]|nr:ABC transporter ATP-binding protein [Ignavibacteria bacterium]